MLVRWGVAGLPLAALPLLPLAFEQSAATALERPGEYVESVLRLSNLANFPALFYGVLVRGPRVIADAFFAWSPGVSSIVLAAVLAIEGAAVAGLVAALRTHRALALAGLALVAVVAGTIALVRPATPFYLTYALLPLLAGIGAIGLAWRGRAPGSTRCGPLRRADRRAARAARRQRRRHRARDGSGPRDDGARSPPGREARRHRVAAGRDVAAGVCRRQERQAPVQ